MNRDFLFPYLYKSLFEPNEPIEMLDQLIVNALAEDIGDGDHSNDQLYEPCGERQGSAEGKQEGFWRVWM